MSFLTTVETALEAFSTFLLAQAIDATLVVLVVLVISRFVRHGAVIHALWLVVVLKLLTPPIFEVPLPSEVLWQAQAWWDEPTFAAPPEPPPAPSPTEVFALETAEFSVAVALTASSASIPGTPIADRAWGFWAWLGLLFAAGSLGLAILGIKSSLRFRRQLRQAKQPAPELILRLHALAERLGLDVVPRMRILDARLSPMLWTRWPGAELLLPASLLNQLGSSELDAVLTHELAHFKRRDHWVRVIEMMAVGLFWWNPLLSFVRNRLHQAEERACDVWVQRLLPGSGRAYAGALLKTLEFLKPSVERCPALACAIQPKNDWKERLTMIVTEKTALPLRAWQRGLLALAAILLLAVVPTLAEPGPSGGEKHEAEHQHEHDHEAEHEHDHEAEHDHELEAEHEHAQHEAEQAHRELERHHRELERHHREMELKRHEIEKQHLALEEKRAALRQQEIELEVERHQTAQEMRTAMLEAEAARLEARGHHEEAVEMREELGRVREEAELVAQRLKLEREEATQLRETEILLQRARLEAQDLRLAGRDEEAERAERRIAERHRELEREARRVRSAQVKFEKAEIVRQRAQMRAEVKRMRERGDEKEAAELDRALVDLEEVEASLTAHEAELEAENEP